VSKLTLFLLGQPRIERDSIPVTVDTRKAIALIAYVAATHQRHNRDMLAAFLWPEYDRGRAFANLRRTVWGLNKALAGDYLDIDRDTISLKPSADLWLDVDRFRELLGACLLHGHHETHICPDCLQLLTKAVEIYRGDFLHGFTLHDSPGFDEWQFFQVESLQQQFAHALERLVHGYRAQGEFEAAISYARRWLALDVLHEPAHRALIELYAWSGQYSAALRQYQECARALEQELGVAPEEATVQLYQAIKAKQLPALPDGARPTSTPEQAPLPAHDSVANAVLPVPRPAHNLPIQPAPFVGRAEELAEIAALIHDPACRFLTLVGPGGIGKTRLAIRAAAEQLEAFAHGVYFVPCAAVNSTISLISAIADALQFSFYAGGDPKQQLLDFMRPKSLLLVIDNAEHLADAVEVLAAILSAASTVKILATSIERLNLREEWMLEIQGLRYPEHERDPDLEQYSAVQLFIQGARRADAGFVASDQDKPYIVRICRLVAGMPLGIELAASWVRLLSCQEIAGEVENNLDFLATSLRNVPERHRSMRAVFEHTWNLLSDQEQHVLGRLAIFRGGFHRAAAESVAGATLPLLLGLVDKSLLRRNAMGSYEMLHVIRQYAEAKLDQVSLNQVRSLHCAYYAALPQQLGEFIKGGRQKDALTEIKQELENMSSAWMWAVEHGKRRESQMFASNLYLFYEMQSRFQEGEELFRRVAERLSVLSSGASDDQAGRDLLTAQILARRGGFCYRLGLSERAIHLLKDSLTTFRVLDELGETAFCLTCLGDIARIKGEYREARTLLEESLAICEKTGDRRIAARAFTNLGIVAGSSGEYREARQLFQRSLAIFQALGDLWGEAKVLINLGVIAYYLHEYVEAQNLLHKSLTAAVAIDNHYDIAISLNNLGMVAYEREQYTEAKRLHQESCTMFKEIGYRLGAGLTLNDLGHVARALGEAEESRAYFREALKTAVEIEATPLALDVLVGMAMLIKDNETEWALELLTLTSQHAASGRETRDRAARLLAELETRGAGQDRDSTRAATRTFEELVGQFLSDQLV
jgi:predicted ATPase/DNA-binding SARP family transcriptional activator/Tfp pilus assembly protein PilF